MKKFFALIFVTFSLFTFVAAKPSETEAIDCHGAVVDPSGNPIDNVGVYIFPYEVGFVTNLPAQDRCPSPADPNICSPISTNVDLQSTASNTSGAWNYSCTGCWDPPDTSWIGISRIIFRRSGYLDEQWDQTDLANPWNCDVGQVTMQPIGSNAGWGCVDRHLNRCTQGVGGTYGTQNQCEAECDYFKCDQYNMCVSCQGDNSDPNCIYTNSRCDDVCGVQCSITIGTTNFYPPNTTQTGHLWTGFPYSSYVLTSVPVSGATGTCTLTGGQTAITTDASGNALFTFSCNAVGTYQLTAVSTSNSADRNRGMCSGYINVVAPCIGTDGQGGGCQFLFCRPPQNYVHDGWNPQNPTDPPTPACHSDPNINKLFVCCVPVTTSSIIARPTIPPIQQDTAGGSGYCVPTAVGCINVTDTTLFDSFVIQLGIGLGGGIAFILILFSGFLYMTSAGDPEKVKSAKNLLISAVGGLLLIIFSVFILELIGVQVLKLPGL